MNRGGKRAVLFALMGASATLLLTEVAIAHKAISDDDDLVVDSGDVGQKAGEAGEGIDGQDLTSQDASASASDLEANIQQKSAAAKEPFDPVVFIQKYVMESCFMAFFVLCFVVLFIGKRHNAAIAQLWHTKSLPLIRENFACVGMEDGRVNVAMEQTSWSEYTFYASGRKNCFYSLYKLDMEKRHCFFSKYVLSMLNGSSDVLTVDIPILFKDGDYDGPPPYPIEFFLTQKSRQKAAMDVHEHFKSLLYPVRASNLPVPKPPANKKEAKELAKKDYLIVLGENEEIVNQLIDNSIGETLRKYGHCLYELHITDQQVYNKYPVFMRARIEIGSTEESMTEALQVLQVVLQLIDKVVRLRLSESTRAKCEKNRKKTPSAQAKQVDQQKSEELEDKLRKQAQEEKDKLKKMTPDQRKKYEEKKKKQDLQNQKKRMSKLVKH